jgi:hypothetical protein
MDKQSSPCPYNARMKPRAPPEARLRSRRAGGYRRRFRPKSSPHGGAAKSGPAARSRFDPLVMRRRAARTGLHLLFSFKHSLSPNQNQSRQAYGDEKCDKNNSKATIWSLSFNLTCTLASYPF